MKQLTLYYICTAFILAGAFTACKKEADGSTTVYMPAGTKTVYTNFDQTDTVLFTASLVGADYATVAAHASNDITVNFTVNTSLIDIFNQENGTSYTLLPADNYTIESSGIIEKGKNETTGLKLVIKNGDQLAPFSSYLLPVSISEVSGGQASKWQTTTYYVITRSPALEDLPVLDRSGWTIAGYSTQEPAEGNGNGLATAAIDENWDSYWQSQWAGNEPSPPHFITIDMGASQSIHGVSIVDRAFSGDWATDGHGQPKAITVALSQDGVNFTDNGSFLLPTASDPQKELRFFLPVFSEARYFRVTVTSVWATNSTNIAEIYAL